MRFLFLVFASAVFLSSCEEKKSNGVYDNAQSADEPKGVDVNEGTGTSIGDKAPDIALASPQGEVVKLSSLRGKYVLLDFWASWCGPCRGEVPYVKEAYSKFKDKGFEVYGVSLDRDREDWVKAIDNWGLNWIHVSDLGFWNSSVVPQYQISGIPATFLLDKEGKIIARDLRGPNLEAKLAEVMK